MADHTYRRVMVNGEWGFRRVEADSSTPSGSPVFPAVVGDGNRKGEGRFNTSAKVDHMLKRDRVVITSRQLEQHAFAKAVAQRLTSYSERGFAWVIESDPYGGKSTVALFNERLGQQFIIYFKNADDLQKWIVGQDARPQRIVRKNVPYEEGDSLDPTLDGDGVEYLIFGRPTKNDGFGRMVELD